MFEKVGVGGSRIFCNHKKLLGSHTGGEDAAKLTGGIKIWRRARRLRSVIAEYFATTIRYIHWKVGSRDFYHWNKNLKACSKLEVGGTEEYIATMRIYYKETLEGLEGRQLQLLLVE